MYNSMPHITLNGRHACVKHVYTTCIRLISFSYAVHYIDTVRVQFNASHHTERTACMCIRMSFTCSERDPLGIRQLDYCDNSTRTTRTTRQFDPCDKWNSCDNLTGQLDYCDNSTRTTRTTRQFDPCDKWNSCDNPTWAILYQCLEVDHRVRSKKLITRLIVAEF